MANDLLRDLPWRFHGKRYADVATFVSEVEDYSQKILKRAAPWTDAVIIPERHILLRYEAVRGGAYDDAFVELRTDATDGFTAAEFLWQVHEALAEDELADHCFFEGVSRVRDGDPPLYAILQGS